MNIKRHIKEFVKTRSLNEGFDEEGKPDTKYYAFDCDDNIMFMPTSIMLLSENYEEVPMSTEDFAEHRHQIGKESFSYKGTTIVDYAPNPFRNFREEGDKRFVLDSMIASVGPSWNDFIECVNGGYIFAIITARGHNPKALREGVYNLIMANKNGIDTRTLAKNLNKYRNIGNEVSDDTKSKALTPNELREYLDLCKFYPVTFGEGSAANPEEGKIKAMKEFISYCKDMAREIGEKAYFKNDVENNEILPIIGFSDDDPKNIETMKDFLDTHDTEKLVRTYLTKGGEKKEY